MRLDLRDRLRDHRGRHPHVVRLDAAVVAACVILYAIGRLADAQGVLPPVVRQHGFDVLATPALLGIANILTAVSPFGVAPFRHALPALALTLFGAALWEGVAPLYTASTADWWDVAAYFTGTGLYLMSARAAALEPVGD